MHGRNDVGKIKHCPVVSPHGDAVPPCNWNLDWPEDEDDTKRNPHREE